MRKAFSSLLLACALTAGTAWGQAPAAKPDVPLKYGATRLEKRQDDAMRKFRDNRLGAFIHWGLYAIPGGEWDGKVYRGAAEWLKSWAKVPSAEWLELNPWLAINQQDRRSMLLAARIVRPDAFAWEEYLSLVRGTVCFYQLSPEPATP